jgi:FtsP/CotA-like multicopper oxidase with cupredoxin domain
MIKRSTPFLVLGIAVLATVLSSRAGAQQSGALTLQAVSQDLSHVPAKTTSFLKVQLNDNHRPAGHQHNHVLALSLIADTGMWYPAGENEPGIPIQVFRDANGPLQIPGPLIRVPAGTEIRASVRNVIPGTSLTVHGLSSRPAANGESDESTTKFGETSEVRFRLDVPGTYYYWGTTTNSPLEKRYSQDSQLSGAIVVDPPGTAPDATEEIFVIGIWINIFRNKVRPFIGSEMALINGRSWPNTQRLTYTQGDTVHWRWINTAFEGHPLHLHGFYFRVDSRGNGQRDNVYNEDSQRDMVVTERLDPGDTRTISWIPERPGNWLFHCHNPFHFRSHFPLAILISGQFPERGTPEYDRAFESTHDMGGMVLGVTVRPKAGTKSTAEIAPKRYLTLTADVPGMQRANTAEGSTGAAVHAYRYFLGEKPDPDSSDRAMGPPIVLSRGEPVSIIVRNRLPEATSVHWHGIELESYYDGVPGFGTDGHRTSPMIEPGQSFEARFTPPRAGTFIYHTHMNDLQQVMAGLSGPLIVLSPDEKFDPARDHVIFITHPHSLEDQAKFVFVNGMNPPEPLNLLSGVRHRFRIVNFHAFMANLKIEIKDDSGLLSWRALAKDGRDLPENQRTIRPAQQVVSIGETYDFEFTADKPGNRRLEIFDPILSKVINSVQLHVRQLN